MNILSAQTVLNGSVTGTPVGNSALGNATGWSVCSFSPDLCDISSPGYLTASTVPAVPSPDGGSWLGVASVGSGECAQTSISGLTSGQVYTLCFYGANFGCGAYNGLVGEPRVAVGATTQTFTLNQGSFWTLYSMDFTADASNMVLSVVIENLGLGNAYCGLDGFTVGQVACAIPLPVEMIEFRAVPKDVSRVELSWETASEENNNYFRVERSIDLENWEQVGIQKGVGNSFEVVSYEMTDNTPFYGRSYYRLIQVDFNGYESNNGIIAVELLQGESEAFLVSPNPTNGKITIKSEKVDALDFELFNSIGKKMPLLILSESGNELSIDLAPLPAGIYFLWSNNVCKKIVKN